MNKTIVLHYVSLATLIGSGLYIFPAIVSLIYSEFYNVALFLIIGACIAIVSLPCVFITQKIAIEKKRSMYAKDAFAISAIIWILFSLYGALPFFISGEIPNFFDAFFESASGYTTTGATILSDIEALSKGMLFWRSIIEWVGGMGVLVFAIAVMPSTSNSLYLMQAECPGPEVGKIVPRGKKSAMTLYGIYAMMTVILIILLCFGGMPLYDSICNAMSTAGTCGFCIKNDSIGFYNSAYIDGVITAGMILFGVNFNLYYYMLIHRFKEVKKNTEVKVYFLIIAIAIALIMINIYPQYNSIGKTFRYTSFQVGAVISSTCLSTADFDKWPVFSQCILLLLMFIGASSGSAGGGFKVQRFVILIKSANLTLRRLFHPNSVNVIRNDGKIVDSESSHSVMRYLVLYLGIMVASILLVSLNNADFGTTFSAVLSCFNNMGPGINKVGPVCNYGFLSNFSKAVLSFDMLCGRLECLPFLILFSPSAWKKRF